MFPQTQIAALLHDEHLKTLAALQSLESLLRRHPGNRTPDLAQDAIQAALRNVIAALESDIQNHFAFEETYLFPLLEQAGEFGITGILQDEHESIRPLAKDISAMAASALDDSGFADAAWKDFHGLGMELCEREIFHIQKEEMGLLGVLGAFVDPEMDAQLSSIYQSLDRQA